MFSLVAAADFSGTSHSRSSKTLGTLYRRREERRVTSPSRVYFFCNRFLPFCPPSSLLPPSPPPDLSLSLHMLVWKESLFSFYTIAPLSYLPSRRSLRSFSFSFSRACLSLISSRLILLSAPRYSNDLGWWIWPSLSCHRFATVIAAISILICARGAYGSPHARTHARTHGMHVCTFADWLPPFVSPRISFISLRVRYVPLGTSSWLLSLGIL